ncbi:LysR family transcriptional regulator [Bordetella trematum]|uniref:LysR family transcriptional regulator n=1 Tax=Bordetella trematum TaxID=123899 RepID=UPI0039896C23
MLSLSLKYFLDVAQHGSIASAAQASHVAASAISRQIAKLEDAVGAPLFERQARGMMLSHAGQQLAAYANLAALEAERVIAAIRERQQQGDVTITLASTEGFAHRFLPACMADFRRRHPAARFHLKVQHPDEVNRLALEGLVHLALRYTTAQDERLKTEFLGRAPVCAMMCRHHPLAGRRSVAMRDLARWPLSVSDPGTTARQLFDAACANAGLHIEPAYVANQSAVFLPMLPGSDIVLLSGYLAVMDLLEGAGLTLLPITNPEMRQRSMQVVTLQGRTLPPLAREFVDFVCERLSQVARLPPA